MTSSKINSQLLSLLNDLVKINYSRIDCYNQALASPNIELHFAAALKDALEKSKVAIAYLSDILFSIEEEDSSAPGHVFRDWMKKKNTFKLNIRAAMLENCEFEEDAALRAYEQALASPNIDIPTQIREQIIKQQIEIKISRDLLQQFRNIKPGKAS